MADSPRISFTGSRPPSRAHSEASNATERPDSASGPRSITREIEHIKALVHRVQHAPLPTHTTITAQVFRQRSGSSPVTTAHIIHELDQLKRRLKHEQQQQQQLLQQQAAQRLSEVDPETESEVEPDDVLDEREVDLERAREEVMMTKRYGEQLLEAAELKVDGLTDEKERLEGTLNEYRDQIGKATRGRLRVEDQLRKVQHNGDQLVGDVKRLQLALQQKEDCLKQLQTERAHSESLYSEEKSRLSRLEDVKTKLEVSLTASEDRVSHLETEKKTLTERLDRVVGEHATNDESLRKQLEVLQEKQMSMTEEVEQSNSRNRDMQKRLNEAEARTAQMKAEHESQNEELVAQITEHKRLLENALKDVGTHTQEFEELRQDRETVQARANNLADEVEEYQIKLGAAIYEHDRAEKSYKKLLEELEARNEQATRELQVRHADELEESQEMLSKTILTHATELQVMRAASDDQETRTRSEYDGELEKMRTLHAEQLDAVRKAHEEELDKVKSSLSTELTSVRADNEEQQRLLNLRLEDARSYADQATALHASELAGLDSTHRDQIQTSNAELDALRIKLTDSERQADLRVAQLQDLVSEHATENESLRDKLQKAEESHNFQANSLSNELQTVKEKLNASTSRVFSLEASAKATDEGAAAKLIEKDEAITSLRDQAVDLQMRLGSQIAELQHEIADMSSAIASRDAKLAAINQLHQEAINELNHQNSKGLKELETLHRSERERLQSQFDASANAGAQDHALAISDLERSHEETLEAHKKQIAELTQQRKDELAKNSRELRDEHAIAISSLQEAHEKALSDSDETMKQRQQQLEKLTKLANDAFTRVKTLQQENEELEAQHKVALHRLGTEHETALVQVATEGERVNQSHEERVQRLISDWTTEREGIHQEHGAILEKTSRDAAVRAQQMEEHYSEERTNSISRHHAELAELHDKHALEKDELREDYATQLQNQNDSHNAALQALSEECSDLKRHIKELQEENEAKRAASEAKWKQRQADHGVALYHAQEVRSGLEVSHIAALRDLESRHNEAIATLQQGHNLEFGKQSAEHEKAFDALKSAHEEKLHKMQSDNEEANNRFNAEVSRLRDEIQSTKEATVKDRLHLEGEHRLRISKLEADLSQSVHDMSEKHKADIQRINEEAAQKVAEARRCYGEDLTDRDKLAQDRLAAAQEAHNRELAEMQQCLKAEIDEAQSKAETAKAELEARQSVAMERLRTEHSHALEGQGVRHREQHQAMQSQHRSAIEVLENKLNEAKAELNLSQLEHERVTAKLHEQHIEALKQLQAHHGTETDALRSKSSTELDRARKDADEALSKLHFIEASYTDQIAALKSNFAADLKASQDRLASAEAGNATQRVRFEENLKQAQLDNEATLASLVADHSLELEAVRHVANQSDTRRNGEHEAAIKQLKEGHDKRIRELEEARDAEATQLKAENDNAIASLKKEHRDSIEQAKANQERVDGQRQKEHDTSVTSLKAEHHREVESLRAAARLANNHHMLERSAAVATLQNSSKVELEQVREELSRSTAMASEQRDANRKMQEEHDRKVAKLIAEHDHRVEELQQRFMTTSAKQHIEHEQAFLDSKAVAAKELAQIRQDHARALDIARSEGTEVLEKAQAAHELRIASLLSKLEKMQHSHTMALQTHNAEAETDAIARLDALRSSFTKAEQEAEHARKREIDELKAEHEKSLSSTKLDLENRLQSVQERHDALAKNLQLSIKAQTEETATARETALAARDEVWGLKMSEMQSKHETSIAELIQSAEEQSSKKLKELAEQHAENLAQALDQAHTRAAEKSSLAEQQHHVDLEAAAERARQSGQAELRNLKKRHQDAIVQIRDTSQKQNAAQLEALEQSYKQQMESALVQERLIAESQLRNTTETHQSELLRLGAEYQTELAELERHSTAEREALVLSTQTSFNAEITALKARLDASMTGQAEAERSAAGLRQQLAQTEKRVAEAKSASENELIALRDEKEDLTSQLEKVQTSLHDLQGKVSSGATTPKTKRLPEELINTKLQLESFEEERAIMRLTLQKRLDEKSELSRQNDFLVKELEALLAQRSRPQMPPSNKSDAFVQTEPFISEPKSDAATFMSIKESRIRSLRPATPLSPGLRQAKEDVDILWNAGSFEHHLQNLNRDFDNFGSTVFTNEHSFTQKTSEHVGELEKEKDPLAVEYKTKIDALAAHKERVEKMVTSKQAEEFTRERSKLVVQHGAGFDDAIGQTAMLTSLPVGRARALRTAEERLVKDFNQRIARRKTQIALKHAEEFHTITQEYYKKIAELLSHQSGFDGDDHGGPLRIDGISEGSQSTPLHLVMEGTQDKSRSHIAITTDVGPQTSDSADSPLISALDRRARTLTPTWTSHPRTSSSIPRSSSVPRGQSASRRVSPEPPPAVPKVPFTENEAILDAFYEPRRGYPPVAQRSLMRAKNPPDFLSTPRSISNASSPVRPSTPKTPTTGDQHNGGISHDTEIGLSPSEPHQPRDSVETQTPTSSVSAKSSFLRRMKDRLSSEGPRLSSSITGSRQGRPRSRIGISPTPDSIPEDGSSPGTETPVSSAGIPKWRPKRTRSKQLSSGMIYYNAPKHMPSEEYD